MRVRRAQMCRFARRTLFGGACAVSAALAAPALAAAATDVSVSSSGKTLEVVAKNNATNNVVVSATPTHLVVTDSGAGVDTSDPLCAKASPIVSCPIGQITTIEIKLGNRNDAAGISATPGSAVPASINASIDGGTGNDALFGGLAADKLRGSANSDFLVGGDGADDLGGGSGNDNLQGGPGPDSLAGDQNNDLLDGGAGGDLMRGGSGSDTVTYATRSTGVSATIGGPAHQSGNAEDGAPAAGDTIDKDVENLIGGAGGDLLVGDGDANVLSGGDGADFLLGGAGSDRLVGRGGDDFIAGDVGDDILKGGSGSDVFKGGDGNDLLRARDGTADQKLRCGPGFDRVRRDKQLDPRPKGCELPAHRRHRR